LPELTTQRLKMPQYTEADVELAIEDVLEGVSIRRAALLRGVPRQTVNNRILGRQTNRQVNEANQRLTNAQEERVAKWILTQEALGYAPTHGQTRFLVQKILAKGGDTRPLGKKWLDGLKERRPEVRGKLGRRRDFRRANGASPENIEKFFALLDTVSWVKPENIYNTDETGIMEGQGINGLVL